MTFDYGAKLSQPQGSGFKEYPREGFRTALIDADLLPYKIGHIIDKDEFENCLLDLNNNPLTETSLFQYAKHLLDSAINNWIETAKCDSALFFLTEGKNFRFHLAYTAPYKGKRLDTPKPPFFYELKKYIADSRPTLIGRNVEADDLIAMALTQDTDNLVKSYIVPGSEEHLHNAGVVAVSIDKDIPTVAGVHCNPDKGEIQCVSHLGDFLPKYKDKELINYVHVPMLNKVPIIDYDPDTADPAAAQYYDRWTRGAKKGEIKTKRIKRGTKIEPRLDELKGTGLRYFYAQIILGDTVDCYPGIPGKGGVAALDALSGCDTEKDLYMAVLGMYKDHYGSGTHKFTDVNGKSYILTAYHRMVEQGRLAWMLRRPNEMWRYKSDVPVLNPQWFIDNKGELK
jgi:hypothetical protein